LENEVIKSGEYQLPDALRRLVERGQTFKPGEVKEWLDCGNKEVTVYTNQRVLEFDSEKGLNTVDSSVSLKNAVIIPPCYIGKDVILENSVVGPHVSLGNGTKVTNSIVLNSIVQENSSIINANLKDSMIGNFAAFRGKPSDISLGDYSTID
jgi:glucose-1-phosphate thymidylyltransferase